MERPWENLTGQVVLGGEAFVRTIQARLKGKKDREVPSLRRLAVRPSWEAIARKAVAIYLGGERGWMSLKELGKRVGLKESSVSQTAGRVTRLRQENKAWDKALIKIEQSLIHKS